jgi:hypothetical protein
MVRRRTAVYVTEKSRDKTGSIPRGPPGGGAGEFAAVAGQRTHRPQGVGRGERKEAKAQGVRAKVAGSAGVSCWCGTGRA